MGKHETIDWSDVDDAIRQHITSMDYQPASTVGSFVSLGHFSEFLRQSTDDAIFMLLVYSVSDKQFRFECHPISDMVRFREKNSLIDCNHLELYAPDMFKTYGAAIHEKDFFQLSGLLSKNSEDCKPLINADSDIIAYKPIPFSDKKHEFTVKLQSPVYVEIEQRCITGFNDTLFFDVNDDYNECNYHCAALIAYAH